MSSLYCTYLQSIKAGRSLQAARVAVEMKEALQHMNVVKEENTALGGVLAQMQRGMDQEHQIMPESRQTNPTEFFDKFGSHVLTMMELAKYGFTSDKIIVPPSASFWLIQGNKLLGKHRRLPTSNIEALVDKTIVFLRGQVYSGPEDGISREIRWVSYLVNDERCSLGNLVRAYSSNNVLRQANNFYEALGRAYEIWELNIALDWDITQDVLEEFAFSISATSIIDLSMALHVRMFDTAKMGSRSLPAVLLMFNNRLQSMRLKCVRELFLFDGKFSFTFAPTASTLRRLSIDDEFDCDDAPSKACLLRILENCRSLEELTLSYQTLRGTFKHVISLAPNLKGFKGFTLLRMVHD
ncbi:hypothetical protein BGX28_004569 [Mortierella sp. GBA30]|nr:hypothetical protein BGX28_004569 [Mortierella sp. GBA30]